MSKFLLLLFLPIYCFGQTSLGPNSIGLAYVAGYEGTEGSHILIDLAFPSANLRNNSAELNRKSFEQTANIKIYNVSRSYLLLDTTATFNFKVEFWCENDGGTQYRPTAHLKVDTYELLGDYLIEYDLQDLLGFAVIDLDEEIKPVEFEGYEPRITLNTSPNSNPNAIIWTVPDDAENCDGEPNNNLMIFLKTANGNFRMRCCGP
ncbi:hypothetical protein [Marinoscillum sp.]|uniref:hypothetical protein n=1 Tax=Marinoscillum sp. TaxID=2024838 RepID=UPI003BABEDC5